MNSLIKKAIISEKSFREAALGKFTFMVDGDAEKDDIAAVCEELFGVNVLSVNVANIKGKIKMTKRVKGKRSDYKKAVITLKKGQKIDLFEMETPEEGKKGKDAKKESKTKEIKDTAEVKTEIKRKGKKIEQEG